MNFDPKTPVSGDDDGKVTLKAILSYYGIPISKQRADFETLMNSIDDHFRDKGVQLPYRRDLTELNSERNMVQHNAHEPEESGMEEWRVFTEKFLRQGFQQYFGLDFEQVSQLELVEDQSLRNLLGLAVESAASGAARESLLLSKFAMEFAVESCIQLSDFSVNGSFGGSFLSGNDEVTEAIEQISSDMESFSMEVAGLADSVAEIAGSVALLARGVDLVDYERFGRVTPDIGIPFEAEVDEDLNQRIAAQERDEEAAPREKRGEYYVAVWNGRRADGNVARWAAQFAIATVVQLQSTEPAPCVRAKYQDFAQELLKTRGAVTQGDEPSDDQEKPASLPGDSHSFVKRANFGPAREIDPNDSSLQLKD